MRLATLALATAFGTTALLAQDPDRSVKDGGIKAPGWEGRVDRRPTAQGKTLADSKFAAEAGGFRLSVGPAAFYWNDRNQASGDYVVKATFKEHKMAASHPHSYGIFIGGSDLKADTEKLLYCIVYGDGSYTIRMFHGAKVTTLVSREANPALRKAGESGEATNEVGWRVQDGKAACVVNGTEVKSFDRSELVGPEKLASLDGVYGIRVSHNLELTVTGLALSKP